MNFYALVVFVHVFAAVPLLSASIVASPAVRAFVRRARTTREIRAYLAVGHPLLLLEPLSALIVLATGIYLASAASFWSHGWLQMALVLWIVNAVAAGAVVKPALGRLTAHTSALEDLPVSPDLDAMRWSTRWSVGGDLLFANDVAVLFLMTVKPGWPAALMVVAGVNVAVSLARVIGSARVRSEINRHDFVDIN